MVATVPFIPKCDVAIFLKHIFRDFLGLAGLIVGLHLICKSDNFLLIVTQGYPLLLTGWEDQSHPAVFMDNRPVQPLITSRNRDLVLAPGENNQAAVLPSANNAKVSGIFQKAHLHKT